MSAALLRKLRDAGVLEAGRVPAHELLARPATCVVANGADNTPLARADSELVARYPQDIARGLKLAMQAVGANKAAIALLPTATAARTAMAETIAEDGRLKFCTTEIPVGDSYPAGDARILAATAAGNPLPSGGAPPDLGIAVLKVRTLLAIAEADRGQPATHELVTIAGAVKRPVTLWAPIGLAIGKLVEAAGGLMPSALD
ncbi:MAG: SLBB domain-containing protein, partial [Cyanobacteria bacterium REEB65]|nr:SLBB domain-containing protein [Cyanobacteria bacterium REEB65]